MGRAHTTETSAATMTVAAHLQELRRRFTVSAIVFLAASVAAYEYRTPLLHLLLAPLKGEKLIYLNPAGGFNFILLISIYAGAAAATPFFLSQLYGFVRPVLPNAIQRQAGKTFIASLLLLICGIAFGYYFAIPGALHFLYSFADNYVNASLTADSYLNFIVAYTLGLGLVFQLPLILMFIHWVRPIKPSGLLKSERWVILLAFILAAFITPTPDPYNQTIVALPIIVVYQFGVVAVLISTLKAHRRRRAALKVARKAARREARLAVIAAAEAAVTEPVPEEVPVAAATPAPARHFQVVRPGQLLGEPMPGQKQRSRAPQVDGFAPRVVDPLA